MWSLFPAVTHVASGCSTTDLTGMLAPGRCGPLKEGEHAQRGLTLARKGGFPTGLSQPGLSAALAVAPSWSCHPGHNY